MSTLPSLVAASPDTRGILIAIYSKDEHQRIHTIFNKVGGSHMCCRDIHTDRYPFAYRVSIYGATLATSHDELAWYQSSSFASLPTYRVSQLIDTIYRRR